MRIAFKIYQALLIIFFYVISIVSVIDYAKGKDIDNFTLLILGLLVYSINQYNNRYE